MANAMLAVNFVPNKFGRVRLELNGYQFMVKTTRGDRRYWKCIVPQCPATVNTHYDNITKFGNNHTHAANTAKVKADEVLQMIKQRSIKETTPIPTIYDEESAKLRSADYMEENPDHDDVIAELPTFYQSRMSMYRARNKETPKLPSTRTDIQLEGKWTETLAGERFLVSEDGNADKILIFSTTENLTNLVAADIIYGDGTFYTSPTQFHQLYTLHTTVHGVMYPLVFALLPGKSEQTYDRFFTLLKAACQQRGLQLSPQAFFTDFETATRNAALRAFPNITLRSCFFHYTQCIWRKTQKLGLVTAYKEDEDMRLFVRRAAILPLVPAEFVEDVWFNALEDAEDLPFNTTPFADYVTEYWVEGNDRHQWNHFVNEGPRTNNHLEGWHSKLKKLVNHAHPNIYQLIDLLQKTQANTEANQIQIRAGGKQRPQQKKY